VLATSLNQLLTLSPLPPLFMRMVIQVGGLGWEGYG
jgi:hypothetical protein